MDVPVRFLPTQRIAPETFLIRQVLGEGMGPTVAPINSMVIRGAEPVVVDTGLAVTRPGWLARVEEVVDLADVRWVFVSHDDTDHVGGLHEVLERAPHARLVTTMFAALRLSADRLLPLDRLHLVDPGGSFAAGDRTFEVLVPPTYDNPTSRALFDTSTGVCWAGDSFACETTRAVDDVDDLDPAELEAAFLHINRLISPWHTMLDPVAWARHLAHVADRDPEVVVGAHGPAFHGHQVDTGFDLLARLPHLPPAPLVTQTELDALLALVAAPASAPA